MGGGVTGGGGDMEGGDDCAEEGGCGDELDMIVVVSVEETLDIVDNDGGSKIQSAVV